MIADLNGEAAKAAAAVLCGRGLGVAHAVSCDVSRGDPVKALVGDDVARHGCVDV